MINQSALCKLITVDGRNTVNLKDNGFLYCNGFIMAECDYNMDKVISKLFRVRALKAGKEFKPEQTADLSKMLEATGEIPALKTDYMRQSGDITGCVFKIGDNYYTYNKIFIDVFEDVTYTAVIDGEKATLRAHWGGKLIGIVLNMRIYGADIKMEMQKLGA